MYKGNTVKYIILLLILLITSCGGGSKEVKQEPEKLNFVEKAYVANLHTSDNYNGQIDIINDKSWVFTSHTNPLCTKSVSPDKYYKSPCRKVDANFRVEDVSANIVERLTFWFMVVEYNLEDAPYWNIILQYWFLLNEGDTNGNHPNTSLKLKVFDGVLNLCHYDNSWQHGYDFGGNVDGQIIDIDHSLHQENTLNGCQTIDIGVSYNVEVLNYHSGRFVFKVNDNVISDKKYQTVGDSPYMIQFGQYWSKFYNEENDPLKRIVVRLDNLTRWVLSR